MDFSVTLTPEEEKFREEVREFIKNNPPESFPCDGPEQEGWGIGCFSRVFTKRMGEAGYLGLTLPQEWGGREGTFTQQSILNEEMIRVGAPIIGSSYTHTIAKWIVEDGTERMKKELLPKLLSGDIIFWMGYTEPNAGSDLFAIESTGEQDGDYFIINGHKSCNTWAYISDWGFFLVNTDPEGRRAHNLSLFFIDGKTPGITIEPILNLGGWTMHCDVYFKDVKVHKDWLVGEKNNAIAVLFKGLEADRILGRSIKGHTLLRELDQILHFLKEDPLGREILASKPWARHALAELRIDCEAARVYGQWCLWKLDQDMPVPYEGSVLHHFAEALGVRFHRTILDILGPMGTLKVSQRFPLAYKFWTWYIMSIPASIAGGVLEIQKDTIARFGLGLKSQ